jgi:hypothetical protein
VLCCVDEVSNPEMSKPLIYRIQCGPKTCCTTPSLNSSPYPCHLQSAKSVSCNQRACLGRCTYRQPPLAAVIRRSCHPTSHVLSLASRLLHSTHYLARAGLLERRTKTAHRMTDSLQVTKACKCTASYLACCIRPSHSPSIQSHSQRSLP